VASLQARHQRNCALGRPWTTFGDATKSSGCTCAPLYHVALRHDGKLVREPVGHNRKEAQRALDARRGDVARREYRIVEDIRFDEWADQWLASLSGKENTRRVYETTINPAKKVFGKTKVRNLDAADVRRFLDHVRSVHEARQVRRPEDQRRPVSPATLAKHLRQLATCCEAAISEGYATENPVKKLHRSARPKAPQVRPVYYTDTELARLWPELAYRPVYAYLCKIAATTGMRFGELAALRWSDVSLLERKMQVDRTYTEGIGETPPKSGKPRTLSLTPQAAALFEEWHVESGGEGLVFERETGGYVSTEYIRRRVLYPALERAGIPRKGAGGRDRDFHSFRHTFARIALENGAELTWVQKQLGHASIVMTVDVYGHWSSAAEEAQAAKLDAVFPV
jgi:integrase